MKQRGLKNLIILLLLCAMGSMCDCICASAKNIEMYEQYAAEGQPLVLEDSSHKKVQIISAAGNKYKVSGKKFTIICKKEGLIVYKCGGKIKQFQLLVGDHKVITEEEVALYDESAISEVDGELLVQIPDSKKAKKKDYTIPKTKFRGKNYTNFISMARAFKKKGWPSWDYSKECYKNTGETVNDSSDEFNFYVDDENKKAFRKVAKYNYNVKLGMKWNKFRKANPYFADDVWLETNPLLCYSCKRASYYDKKSGYVFYKNFDFNEKQKLYMVYYTAYDPTDKNHIVELEKKR